MNLRGVRAELMLLRRKAAACLIALAMAGCGESEPAPPAKRLSLDDFTSAAVRLLEKPKPKPAPQPPRQDEPAPPALAPNPPTAPIVAAPLPVPRPAPAAKPKSKPHWHKKKTKGDCSNGIRGYSRDTIRLAGSAANVERMARARGYTVTPAMRRRIEACFN